MTLTAEERMAAWLDGALTPAEAAAFEADLQGDPDLAARAAAWRGNDRFIADALAPVAQEPIDEALLQSLGLGAPAASVAASAANDNPPWWRRYALPLGGAVAAGLALVLLVAPQGSKPQQDPLSLALDTTPALTSTRLADGRVIEPTLTVRAADGRWCREYRSVATVALACRKDGRWKVEGLAAGSGPAGGKDIALAGNEGRSGLDPLYARLGASDPLGPDDEARMIRQGWGDR
jgi:hypothetical protein